MNSKHGYLVIAAAFGAAVCSSALGDKFTILTGVDARHYPGTGRNVEPVPGPGYPGTFYDGDRLAGTGDAGPEVPYAGLPPDPMFKPNEFGSLSFLYRRGSVPLGPPGVLPFIGIEFLGGPLLDLDGDLDNGSRSLVPVEGETPVIIPDSASFVELTVDLDAFEIALDDFDATGSNEGAPQLGPEIATILVTIAGTQPDGGKEGPINPDIDTRLGTLTPFEGHNGRFTTVYRIENLGFEVWEDSIDPDSGSADVLGTMQFLGTFEGWLIQRQTENKKFPRLAGEGLGSTLWPYVDTSQVGNTFNTANGLEGGSATIEDGVPKDQFSIEGNGGVALEDFDGDLGAYLDAVVVPLLTDDITAFVYLESAGFGINNSGDPVFTDTVGYDAVIVAAASRCGPVKRCDSNCDGDVNFDDIDCFVAALISEESWNACGHGEACDYICSNDANGDGSVDFGDIDAFVECLVGG